MTTYLLLYLESGRAIGLWEMRRPIGGSPGQAVIPAMPNGGCHQHHYLDLSVQPG